MVADMKRFSIAVIPGDGVGQEVTPAAMRVLDVAGRKFDAAFNFEEFAWGAAYYSKNGRMMPANAIDLLRPADARRAATIRPCFAEKHPGR